MAIEKKSLAGKKTAPASKGNSKKFDNSKPVASKVVAARSTGGKTGH
jgi:hypothetical protein